MLGQAPGPIVPTIAHPDLPAEFARAALERQETGESLAQACTYLGEGVPLCFRVEVDGKRNWISVAELKSWGLSLEDVGKAVKIQEERNPLVEMRPPDGGHWWQVEARDGRESMIFLNPEWLSVVGESAVVAAPIRGVVLAWESGDPENDKIMAVGVRALFDQGEAPVSPKLFRYTNKGWVVWGEIVLGAGEAPKPETR